MIDRGLHLDVVKELKDGKMMVNARQPLLPGGVWKGDLRKVRIGGVLPGTIAVLSSHVVHTL